MYHSGRRNNYRFHEPAPAVKLHHLHEDTLPTEPGEWMLHIKGKGYYPIREGFGYGINKAQARMNWIKDNHRTTLPQNGTIVWVNHGTKE